MTESQQPAGNTGSPPAADAGSKAVFGPYTIIPEVTLTDQEIRLSYTINDRPYDVRSQVADLTPHQDKAMEMAMFSRANLRPLLVWGRPVTNQYGQQAFQITEMKFA